MRTYDVSPVVHVILSGQQEELVSATSDGMSHALERSDKLFLKVDETREAALDSEFLSLASRISAERVSRFKTAFDVLDPNDFISRLKDMLSLVRYDAYSV